MIKQDSVIKTLTIASNGYSNTETAIPNIPDGYTILEVTAYSNSPALISTVNIMNGTEYRLMVHNIASSKRTGNVTIKFTYIKCK